MNLGFYSGRELGRCEDCNGLLSETYKRGSLCVVCHHCEDGATARRFQNVFDQARLMTPENELYFVLQLLIGIDETKIERAERLLQEMRTNGRSHP